MNTTNNQSPKVSVIVGIYNVSSFLPKGLKNLENQTFHDFEVILVDDGSTDGSAEICDEIASYNNQVRVIHKKNGGLGSARNTGLDVARGKYIYFFDVDDCIKPSLLDYCVNQMEARTLDILIFGFEAVSTGNKNSVETVSFKEHQINNNNELRDCYIDELLLIRNGNGFAWNKFYRKNFLNRYHLRFENQRIQQDEVFNLLVYPYVERAYISEEVLYTYYIYEKGNTRSRFVPDRFDIYVSIKEHFESLKRHWQLKDKRMDDYLQKRFWNNLILGIIPNLFHPDCPWNIRQKKKELKRIVSHPFTQQCLQKTSQTTKLEDSLYRYAFCHSNLSLLKITYYLYAYLRSLKKKMQKVLHLWQNGLA